MNLEEKILSIIVRNIERKVNVRLDSNLKEEIGVDSFEMLMITNDMEEELKISIDESELQDIVTAGDIVFKLKEKFPQIAG